MRVTGGENPIRLWKTRVLLDCEKQLWHGLVEASGIEMCGTYVEKRRADAFAGAQAQRSLDMFDRRIRSPA